MDLLCAGRAFSHDVFHCAHARDHSARRKFFRILAESSDPYHHVESAFQSVRPAVPEKARLIVRDPRVAAQTRFQQDRTFVIWPDVSRRIFFSALRITIAVLAVLTLLWWFGMRMPGKNVPKAGPL